VPPGQRVQRAHAACPPRAPFSWARSAPGSRKKKSHIPRRIPREVYRSHAWNRIHHRYVLSAGSDHDRSHAGYWFTITANRKAALSAKTSRPPELVEERDTVQFNSIDNLRPILQPNSDIAWISEFGGVDVEVRGPSFIRETNVRMLQVIYSNVRSLKIARHIRLKMCISKLDSRISGTIKPNVCEWERSSIFLENNNKKYLCQVIIKKMLLVLIILSLSFYFRTSYFWENEVNRHCCNDRCTRSLKFSQKRFSTGKTVAVCFAIYAVESVHAPKQKLRKSV